MLRFGDLVDSQTFKQALSSKADLETVIRLVETKLDLDTFESHPSTRGPAEQLAKLEKLIERKADLNLVEKLAEHLLQKADEDRLEKLAKELSKKCDSSLVESLE